LESASIVLMAVVPLTVVLCGAAGLKARLSSLSQALDEEKAARTLAAAEAESRYGGG
jgi:hypothetical protein